MKVLIDATGIRTKVTGVGRYSIEILREILYQNQNMEITLILHSSINRDNEVFTILNDDVKVKYLKEKGIGIRRELMFLLFKVFNSEYYDVFHSLSSNAPFAFGDRSIVTFHDMKYILYPNYIGKFSFLKSNYLKMQFLNAIRRYSKILTVSKSTFDDLIKVFPAYKEAILDKSAIVYNSTNITKKKDVDIKSKYNIKKPYFLYIGELRPHKNVEGLINAFKQFRRSNDAEVSLVIGGKKHPSFMNKFKDIKNLNYIGYVDENDLYSLYKNSIAYCLVSHYEGFGIPILEAMESNTPVITSDISAMPEVAGDAALLVDPENRDSIIDALNRLYKNSDLRDELIKRGGERVRNFSWANSAEQIIEIYQEVVNEKDVKRLNLLNWSNSNISG